MASITFLICALGLGEAPPMDVGAATVVPNAPVSVSSPVPAAHSETKGEVAGPPAVEDLPPATDEAQAPVVSVREQLPLGAPDGAHSGAGDGAEAGASGAGGLGVWQTIACTGAVIGLIMIGRWVVVRTVRSPVGSSSVRSQLGVGGRAPSGLLFVLGRYPVSRGASLVLIQLDRRVLLLSQSGAGFQTLAEVRDAEEVASIIAKARDEEGESLSAKFSTLMRTFDRKHTESERAESVRAVVRPVRVGADGDDVRLGVGPVGDESADAVRERLTALRALVS